MLSILVAMFSACSAVGSPEVGTGANQNSFWEATPGIMRSYRAAFIEEIQILSGDTGRLVVAGDNEMESLASEFRSEIVRALGSKHSVMPVPARGIAIIRVRLTNISSSRTLEALRPGLVVQNNMRGGATIEVSFYDSISGKELARLADTRAGQRRGYFSGLGKWDGVRTAFRDWAPMIARKVG